MQEALRDVGKQLDDMVRGKKEWQTGHLAETLKQIHKQRQKVAAEEQASEDGAREAAASDAELSDAAEARAQLEEALQSLQAETGRVFAKHAEDVKKVEASLGKLGNALREAVQDK